MIYYCWVHFVVRWQSGGVVPCMGFFERDFSYRLMYVFMDFIS